ncbi:MAG TPA: 2OG-Fe(II) oxygenase [Candidatus Didemnitutus sp.]
MEGSGKDIQITYNESLQPLADLLGSTKRPGDHYSAGAFETPMPALAVEGVGAVSFPVPPAQARALIAAAAERAPYGRGDRTLVDENVRKVWQVVPGKLSLRGKGWERSQPALVAKVAADLGCDSAKVSAEFYKLLIYDEGGFFAAHRDTEKSPGMFGTLVVTLPSAHEGGDLIIRHAGRETIVSLRNDDPGEIRYAAFYADCEHEVQPVTRGHRVCLVYNLVHTALPRSPVPPDHRPAVEVAAKILNAWAGGDDEPHKLVYLLEHHYTQAALSFAALKGGDAARARVLKEAAARSGCALHIGIVHIEESGWAEYTGNGDDNSSRRHYWDDDAEGGEDDGGTAEEFEVGEVCGGSYFIDQWHDADDQPVIFGRIALDDAEVLPVGALDAEKPDEEHFSEATGNEGASFERTYLRAALVLWPLARFDEVCASAGLDATIARLGQLIAEATAPGEAADATARKAARKHVHRFATFIPGEWPGYEDHGARLDALLGHLARFGDVALIGSLLPPVLARHYAAGRNPALLAISPVLGPVGSGAFFDTLFAAAAPAHPGGCLDLWRALAASALSDRRTELETLLETLIAAVPRTRKPAEPRARQGWARAVITEDDREESDDDSTPTPEKEPLSPEILAGFLAAVSGTLGDAACIRFVDDLESNPEAFAPETLLLPCLECLAKDGPVPLEAVARLWEQCAAFYLRRSATSPPEPADWAQNVAIPGSEKNPFLRELEAFARDAHARARRFPLATALRSVLHQAIDRAGLDMTHVTERKGRPYTLVCTKTRATYERTLRRYRADLVDLRRLLALPMAQIPKATPTVNRLREALAQA